MSCSAAVLFEGVRGLFQARGFSEKVALSATYFVFSTWFSPSLPVAPCLLVTGAGPESRLLSELLECVVHAPLPLFGLTRGGFLAVDMAAEPTLLVHEGGITDSLWRLLRASNYRSAQVSTASGMRKIYCSKSIFLGEELNAAGLDDSVLQINISPSSGRLPILGADEKQRLSNEFQPKMRAFQGRNVIQVRDSQFDLPGLSSPIRVLARVLGAPLAAAAELQIALAPLLREYQETIRAALWFDPTCAVIEAMLFRSHGPAERVHVGEVADTANAILKGRGETLELEAKEVGSILRRLGLSPTRDKRGYAIRVGENIRRQIHQLASQFAVASVQEGALMLCVHCAEFFSYQPADETRAGSTESRE